MKIKVTNGVIRIHNDDNPGDALNVPGENPGEALNVPGDVRPGENPPAIHPDEKPYKCELCDKSFKHSSHFVAHLRDVHKKIKHCKTCKTYFDNLDQYKTHRMEFHDGKLFHCDICGKTFELQSSIKKHKKNIHENAQHQTASDSHHKCEICDESFQRQRMLNEHKRYMHDEALQDKCHICQKAFSSKANLKRHNDKFHINIPSEENPIDNPANDQPQPPEDLAEDMPPLEDPENDEPQIQIHAAEIPPIRNWLLDSTKKRKGDHLESLAKRIHTEETPSIPKKVSIFEIFHLNLN